MLNKCFAYYISFLIICFPSYSFADTIITNSESVFAGKITSMNNKMVEIQTSDGAFELFRSNIKTIQFDNNTKQETNNNNNLNEIIVPSGFGVPFHFRETLDGNNVEPDQRVTVIVEQDTYLEDKLIFKKDTEGYAVIDTIQKAKSWGRPGRLAISFIVIKDVYDTEHTLNIVMNRKGRSSHVMGKALPIVGGTLVAFPLLLFGFKKGDKVIITPESVFIAYTLSSKTTSNKANSTSLPVEN